MDAATTASSDSAQYMTVGWREWISLPDLNIPAIKAKVDTGARTSAVHAQDIVREKRDGTDWVMFTVLPLQRDENIKRRCSARLLDTRRVTDSGGHSQDRFFVETTLRLGQIEKTIELTLSQRHDMLFRMLLGRTSLVPGIQVDPSLSFLLGRISGRALYAQDPEGVE